MDKLGIGDLTDIEFQTPSNTDTPPEIPFLMGTTISFAWITPYTPMIKSAVSAMLILATFMYLLRNIKGFFS